MGIALIHQEPLAFPDLTVAENIFAGSEPVRGRGLLDWPTIYRRSAETLDSLGLRLNPKTKMRGLSVADQQMVDMAAALSQNARVLLMDEPTAALTPNEVERLFAIIRRLRDQGVALAFISHRLEEVTAISDRLTVMRDGEVVGERNPKTTSHDETIRLMVGRPLQALFERPEGQEIGAIVLEAQHLTRAGHFEDISFTLRSGEIVGLAGLVGAGRSDVAQALFGIARAESGAVLIDDKPIVFHNPREAMARGLAYVPEDRQHQGLLMPMSVTKNMTLPLLPQLAQLGWLRERRERSASEDYVERLRIILRRPAGFIHGCLGNQRMEVYTANLLNSEYTSHTRSVQSHIEIDPLRKSVRPRIALTSTGFPAAAACRACCRTSLASSGSSSLKPIPPKPSATR